MLNAGVKGSIWCPDVTRIDGPDQSQRSAAPLEMQRNAEHSGFAGLLSDGVE